MGVYWNLLKKKQSSSQCVTITDLIRDDSISVILDDEKNSCSLNTYLVNEKI